MMENCKFCGDEITRYTKTGNIIRGTAWKKRLTCNKTSCRTEIMRETAGNGKQKTPVIDSNAMDIFLGTSAGIER